MPADDDAGGHHPRVQLEGVLALGGDTPAGAVGGVEVASAEHQGRAQGQADGPAAPVPLLDGGRRCGPGYLGFGSGHRRAGFRLGGGRGPVVNGVHGDDTSGHGARSRSSEPTCFRGRELPVQDGGHDRQTAGPDGRPR